MNESYVTLQGWVGTDVDERDVQGTANASFRVASTPRYFRNGEWHNGQTSWFTVNCWRTLAKNVFESVRKGDAVVVHGRARMDVWKREGQPDSVTWVIDATFVGHDLTKGTAVFVKTPKALADPWDDADVKAAVHAYPTDGPKVSPLGEIEEPALDEPAA